MSGVPEHSKNPYAVSPATLYGAERKDAGAKAGVGDEATLSLTQALYSPRQIYLAAFLGSPLAAGWFISRNYKTLDRPRLATRMLWLGLVATILAMAIAFVLPDKLPNSLWPLLYSTLIFLYANSQFEWLTKHHYAAGGRKGSWWAVIGISLLWAAILLGVLFGALFGLETAFPGFLSE